MKNRAYQIVACGLMAIFVVSPAGPGLVLHNCRQFGTRSTKVCDCCNAELAQSHSCCAAKNRAEGQPVRLHESGIDSSCCFVSFENSFAFDGQDSPLSSLRDMGKYEIDTSPAILATAEFLFADLTVFTIASPTRHSSDPPSYILTHSFRC